MSLAWAEHLMMILGLWKTKNMMTVMVRTMDRLQSLFCCCSRLRAASDPEVVSCSINYCTLFFALSPFWKKVIFQGWLKKLNFLLVEFWGLPNMTSIFFSHSLLNLKNSWGHFDPHLFRFGWIWRKLWPKIRKTRNKKNSHFEQILKSSYFSFLYIKSTKAKNRP